MRNPLIAKLEHASDLTDTDREVLTELTRRTRHAAAHQIIINEGDRPESVNLVVEGVACRFKALPDGTRQIMALLLPGDFCDLHVAILDAMDHSIATLSACTIVELPRSTILDLTNNHPRIARALWWCTLVDEGTLREWLVNMGRRNAEQRMAHLFCELMVRLQAIGRASGGSYDLPLSQAELGEVLGFSAVHINRTLQSLRDAHLVAFDDKRVTVPDMARLTTFCDFNPNYLHLAKREDATKKQARGEWANHPLN